MTLVVSGTDLAGHSQHEVMRHNADEGLLDLGILGVRHYQLLTIETRSLVSKQGGSRLGESVAYKLCKELALGPGSCMKADKRSLHKLGLCLLSELLRLGLRSDYMQQGCDHTLPAEQPVRRSIHPRVSIVL